MAKQELFTLKSLAKIQGLEADFDATLQAMVRDCRERPGLKQKRKLAVQLEFLPDEKGEDVVVTVQTRNTLPTRVAERYKMMATVNNGLKFSPASPMDPEQLGLDFEDD